MRRRGEEQFKDILPEHRNLMLEAIKYAHEKTLSEHPEEWSLERYKAETGEVAFSRVRRADEPGGSASKEIYGFTMPEGTLRPEYSIWHYPKGKRHVLMSEGGPYPLSPIAKKLGNWHESWVFDEQSDPFHGPPDRFEQEAE